MNEKTQSRFACAAAFEPNDAEALVLEKTRAGEAVVLFDGGEIRGEFLKILMLGLRDDWPVTSNGIHIRGFFEGDKDFPDSKTPVTISGGIVLSDASSPDGGPLPPLTINYCIIEGPINFVGATLANLNLEGCRITHLAVGQANVTRDISLVGIRCQGEALFTGAKIGGRFSADGAIFINPGKTALRLDSAQIDGGVFLFDAFIDGVLFCSDLRLNAQFSAAGMRIENPGGHAFMLERAQVAGGVYINETSFAGEVSFSNLTTDGQVMAIASRFMNRGNVAFSLGDTHIRGGVILDASKFVGLLQGDGITTPIIQTAKARFYNRGDLAVSICRASIAGPLTLHNIRCFGVFDITGSSVGGRVSFSGARLVHIKGQPLKIDNVKISNGLSFEGAFICGSVFAKNCEIGDINFSGARIHPGYGEIAFDLDGASIAKDLNFAEKSGNEWINPAVIIGLMRLNHAHIGGRVCLSGGSFRVGRNDDRCLSFRRARIDGSLETKKLAGEPDGWFNFDGAEIDTIDDDPVTGWPRAGRLDLDGLVYRSITAPADNVEGGALAARRMIWLKRQYEGGEPKHGEFRPQPFEHLAKILHSQGHDYAATKISIEKRELQRKYADRGFARFIHTILKLTSDYGYSPARALAWFAGWVGAGAGFTKLGLGADLYERTSTDSPNALHIEPFVYAFDLATPIIDFGQASAYRLKPACTEIGNFVLCNWHEVLEVGYSTVGFVLFSILVLTLSGVLRREGE